MMPSPENATAENSANHRKFELLSETELNLIAASLVGVASQYQAQAAEKQNLSLAYSSIIYVRSCMKIEGLLEQINEEFGFRELANGARK